MAQFYARQSALLPIFNSPGLGEATLCFPLGLNVGLGSGRRTGPARCQPCVVEPGHCTSTPGHLERTAAANRSTRNLEVSSSMGDLLFDPESCACWPSAGRVHCNTVSPPSSRAIDHR